MGAIEDLAKKFATFCGRQASLPVVSLEEFFEGNDVRYSMGANLSDDDCLTPRRIWPGGKSGIGAV